MDLEQAGQPHHNLPRAVCYEESHLTIHNVRTTITQSTGNSSLRIFYGQAKESKTAHAFGSSQLIEKTDVKTILQTDTESSTEQ